MNYKNWSEEYLLQAENVKKHLDKLKNERKHKCASEIENINSRISLIYQIYLELKQTGIYLEYRYRGNINE